MWRISHCFLTGKLHLPAFQPAENEEERAIPFVDWVKLQLDYDLDQFDEFNHHFHSYERACFPCAFPYKYIVRTETFSEDFQFILRRAGLWESLDAKHKRVGWKKGKFGTMNFGRDYCIRKADFLSPSENSFLHCRPKWPFSGLVFNTFNITIKYK